MIRICLSLWLATLFASTARAEDQAGAAETLRLARRLNEAFVSVAQTVSPSVVVIKVTQKLPPAETGEEGEFEKLPPGFWRRFHEQFERPDTIRGEGSGIILREDGYILTNGHVVEDAESIEVTLKDGRSFQAAVRGSDAQADIAVLKIEARGLPVARMGDSAKTRVGEFAIAIGAPYSLDYTVTFGHISAKGRGNVVRGLEGAAMDQDFIQTDANINPGNSGGPLVNIDGEVIGMNTLIRGMRTGIGFAIPSNLAREVAEKLISEGRFARTWLGIGIRALRDDQELKKRFEGVTDGVWVSSLAPTGPAAKSDLKPGDVITSVDGQSVATAQQLRNEVRKKKPGQSVKLGVVRDGKPKTIKVSAGEWAAPAPK